MYIYFSKLAKCPDEHRTVDYAFIEALLNKADVNFSDKYGQIILHEIAREWHTDVAKFSLEIGADVNKADIYGRTPLHVAVAVNHVEMIEFLLVQNGGKQNFNTLTLSGPAFSVVRQAQGGGGLRGLDAKNQS